MRTGTGFLISSEYFELFIWAWILVGGATFLVLLFQPAPYGRHHKKGWGPQIPSWVGWIVMEIPSPIFLSIFFLIDKPDLSYIGSWTLFILWNIHYFHRAIIQPLSNPGGMKPMPLVVCFSAIFFNIINGYINGRSLSSNSAQYEGNWIKSPRTILGLLLFLAGFLINRHSDNILLNLRKPGETGYKIPYGGFYRWMTCPNYFGEMVEWTGFAISAWSLAGSSFAFWTAANLIPRAISHHKWCMENLKGYPENRGALYPKLFQKSQQKDKQM